MFWPEGQIPALTFLFSFFLPPHSNPVFYFSLTVKKPYTGRILELEQRNVCLSEQPAFGLCIIASFPGSTANSEGDADPGIEGKQLSLGRSRAGFAAVLASRVLRRKFNQPKAK